ncbi:MAG: hypothetical protein AAGN46_10695 [Acidobacteriota bacterium]
MPIQTVNLARRPFVNRRPVRRVAVVLWAVAILLVSAAVWLFGEYWRNSASQRARLGELYDQVEAERDRLEASRASLRSLELADRNSQAAFLNLLIRKRTFPWSRLFDHLEEVLPIDVYVKTVRPSVSLAAGDLEAIQAARRAQRAGQRRATPQAARRGASGPRRARGGEAVEGPDRVDLNLPATARSEDAMLDFVDALYQHESFLDPFLVGEEQTDDGQVKFEVRVTYLVPAPERPPRIDPMGSDEPELVEAESPSTESAEGSARRASARRGDAEGGSGQGTDLADAEDDAAQGSSRSASSSEAPAAVERAGRAASGTPPDRRAIAGTGRAGATSGARSPGGAAEILRGAAVGSAGGAADARASGRGAAEAAAGAAESSPSTESAPGDEPAPTAGTEPEPRRPSASSSPSVSAVRGTIGGWLGRLEKAVLT